MACAAAAMVAVPISARLRTILGAGRQAGERVIPGPVPLPAAESRLEEAQWNH
jgi:hypothetical protein